MTWCHSVFIPLFYCTTQGRRDQKYIRGAVLFPSPTPWSWYSSIEPGPRCSNVNSIFFALIGSCVTEIGLLLFRHLFDFMHFSWVNQYLLYPSKIRVPDLLPSVLSLDYGHFTPTYDSVQDQNHLAQCARLLILLEKFGVRILISSMQS